MIKQAIQPAMGWTFSFRIFVILGISLGLTLTLTLGGNFWQMLTFYTVQSNILNWLIFVILVVRDFLQLRQRELHPPGRLLSLAKHSFMMGVMVTMLVYHFVLRPYIEQSGLPYDTLGPGDLLVHYFIAIMAVLDYLLFDEKGKFKLWDPLLWALLPLAYLAFIFIYTNAGGSFLNYFGNSESPYFFLSIKTLGLVGVARWVGGITAIFLTVAYGLVGLDYLLGRRTRQH